MRYPATATLSVLAVHVRLTCVVEIAMPARFVGTLGACVSGGSTVTITSSVDVSAESLTVRRSVYVPAVSKVAFVVSAVGAENVTLPGPETTLQAYVNALGGAGSPSSLAVPLRVTPAFREVIWSGPALTVGAWLIGLIAAI